MVVPAWAAQASVGAGQAQRSVRCSDRNTADQTNALTCTHTCTHAHAHAHALTHGCAHALPRALPQAVAALTAAPSYLVLDLGSVRGLDATGARTMGVVHMDLAQHGVVLVVTGADHHGIRPLMAAHGVPLPPQPLRWPPEPAQARGAGGAGGGGATRRGQRGCPRPGLPACPACRAAKVPACCVEMAGLHKPPSRALVQMCRPVRAAAREPRPAAARPPAVAC